MAEGSGATFGGWLSWRRKELGVTQEWLADKTDISPSMLRKLEASARRPSAQIAHLLADYFGIPTDEREAFITFALIGRTAPGSHGGGGGDEFQTRAPWRNVHLHRTNLPAFLTHLIGRERERAQARDLLLQPRVRLLTMHGAPGIGKTRLSLQVAADLVEHFPDGVYMVELATITDPAEVMPAIARTFGLKDRGDRTSEEALGDYLGERKMLLLLDNFEQVLDAAPAVVRLVQKGPWLKVLVTSREALHVRGERHFPVPPLPLPVLPALPAMAKPDQAAELASVSGNPAVRLFVERAEDVRPDFVLTRENARVVAQICISLEGLPLAIELAAARSNHFAPGAMLAQINTQGQLNALAVGARDLAPRQRTLRGAIDWSYNLLGEDERRFFRQSGVFAASFTPSAAGAVWGLTEHADGGQSEGSTNPLEILLSLCDQGLVRQETGTGGDLRFALLEAIHQYASEQLGASGESGEARERHASYYLRLAQEIYAHLLHSEQDIWLERFEVEHSNVRAALQWLLYERHGSKEQERVELAAQICAASFVFWELRSHFNEARAWLKKVLERISALAPLLDAEEKDLSAIQGLSPTLAPLWAKLVGGAGIMASLQGDYEEARAMHQEALALRRELGDKRGIYASLNNLGVDAKENGDLGAARRYHSESLAIARELDDQWRLCISLNNLGGVECDLENYTQASALCEESLALAREMENQDNIARALDSLGLIARHQGNHPQARTYHEEALALHRQLGDKREVARVLTNIASVAMDEGDFTLAHNRLLESLSLIEELGDKKTLVRCMSELANLAQRSGNIERASMLLGVVQTLLASVGISLPPAAQREHMECLSSTRAQLSEAQWEATWAKGRSMTMEEAVAYALV